MPERALKGLRYRQGAKSGADKWHCTAENSKSIGRGHTKLEAKNDLIVKWYKASLGLGK
jgi:hypothetical protein